MRGGVDPASQPADYRQAGIGKLVSEFLGRFSSIMGGATRANDADGVMIALLQFAPDIKHDRWRMNFAQRFWVRWRFLRYDSRAKVTHPLKLRGKIDNQFPVRNLIGNFVPDSFDFAKFSALGAKYSLRAFENFEQLPQPHRPDGREHIERDARFGGIHRK